MTDAKTVLNMRFISYATPLELARRWARSDDADDRRQALLLLRGLSERFAHSLEIAQEFVLALIEAEEREQATHVLEDVKLRCRAPNEELLARWGRLARDKADECVPYPAFPGPPAVSIGGPIERAPEALRLYAQALQHYTEAYEVRHGYYPGVNVATLHVLIAAFESDELRRDQELERSRSLATVLLSRIKDWTSEHGDDAVWLAASIGEIQLILGKLDEAVRSYQSAHRHKKCQDFHRVSMIKQLIRITYCFNRIGQSDLGPFQDLTEVFS